MPKYLIAGSYTSDGIKGLMKEGPAARLEIIRSTVEAVGGKVESVHFALGDDDILVIIELPSNLTAASLSLAISASGALRTRTTALLSVAEADEALRASVKFRPPGG